MSLPTTVPEALWAQRSHQEDGTKNIIYLTITAPDCSPDSVELELEPTKVHFKGSSKVKTFAVDLELYAEIDVENSKKHFSARGVDLVLRKKEFKSEFWPRLLKESKKAHYLRTDFDKWVDEEDQEENADIPELPGSGAQFGGGDGSGGFGGIDFSKLGGMGGMEGMDMSALEGLSGLGSGGAPEMGGFPGDAEENDDDDMPELEDSAPEKFEDAETFVPATEAKTSSGIEEISEDKK
ncbi:HSP20-like chaperone [Choiromyces venosus 120613-1]|uniref:HSP20-like chaperone n=1 Tax=Choiromyces venosus 120613-1 TaxID=1336337 RepID=A0A3N4JYJ8_9PEZI|nr:HSP20-like chaperone [Choiromyces venosus 120613-1]